METRLVFDLLQRFDEGPLFVLDHVEDDVGHDSLDMGEIQFCFQKVIQVTPPLEKTHKDRIPLARDIINLSDFWIIQDLIINAVELSLTNSHSDDRCQSETKELFVYRRYITLEKSSLFHLFNIVVDGSRRSPHFFGDFTEAFPCILIQRFQDLFSSSLIMSTSQDEFQKNFTFCVEYLAFLRQIGLIYVYIIPNFNLDAKKILTLTDFF